MTSTTPAAARDLKAIRDKNPLAGFGRAVSYLMNKENFADQKFGVWSRTLAGQVNRNHYFLVAEGTKIVGFAGWALAEETRAKAWLTGEAGDLSSTECLAGDCIVVNGWAADDETVNRFILREMRRFAVGKKAAFFKRYYADGRVRPMVLPLTDAVERHAKNGG